MEAFILDREDAARGMCSRAAAAMTAVFDYIDQVS
jgi:hypothetical protein